MLRNPSISFDEQGSVMGLENLTLELHALKIIIVL
jgi:hypothetical protein